MSDFEAFILNPDSLLIPIEEVADGLRERLHSDGVRFVLSRRGGRSGDIVIDELGAQLVSCFKAGSTMPAALKSLVSERGIAAAQLVDAAYPLLEKLVEERHLIRGDGSNADAPKRGRLYEPGESVRGSTVLARLQQLDDTAVYKVRLPGGGTGALKALRTPKPSVLSSFRREAIVLKALNGGVAPALLDCAFDGDEPYLLLEWIEGYTLLEWGKRARNLPEPESYRELVRTCLELLRAYRQVHGAGILHSDIWPKNIVIQPDGTVRLLDFGASSSPAADEALGPPQRSNHPFFRAPDLAEAELAGTVRPLASTSSEVYSLGAILYLLVSGRPYLDFALEMERQTAQICSEEMISLESRGLPAWPDMEALLRKMLHKDPSQRPSSVAECIESLKQAALPRVAVDAVGREAALDPIPFLRSYAGESSLEPFSSPSASLFLGGAGLAYALLRAGLDAEAPELLPDAEYVVACARQWMEAGPDGSSSELMDIKPQDIRMSSTWHSLTGVALVEALVSHATGEVGALGASRDHFLGGVHRVDSPLEFGFGRAGCLDGLLQMTFLVSDREALVAAGDELACSMLEELESSKSLGAAPVTFYGFAHGWAGILYSLLAWSRHHNAPMLRRIQPFLGELDKRAVSGAFGSYWPRTVHEEPIAGDMPNWCNGSGGFVLMWSEAFLATGDGRWLERARQAGRHCALHDDLQFDLCCGLAGRAACLGVLHRVTGEAQWLEHARRCLAKAKPLPGVFTHSLFKGIPGIELVRLGLQEPGTFIFPGLAADVFGEPLAI